MVLPAHIVELVSGVTVPVSESGLTYVGRVADAVPQLADVAVYDIIAVPGEAPNTVPLAETVATVVFEELHVPPLPVVE